MRLTIGVTGTCVIVAIAVVLTGTGEVLSNSVPESLMGRRNKQLKPTSSATSV